MIQVQKCINLFSIERLNPIFKYPDWDTTNAGVILQFPDPRRAQPLRKAILDLQNSDPSVMNNLLWIVIDNLAVCYSYEVEGNNKPSRYILLNEAPPYIQALARPAIKLDKRSIVTISDELPLSISLRVYWYGKNQRGGVLNSIADFLNAKELIEVIGRESISLREALDNTLTRMGAKTQSDVSYCLTCGEEIKKGKQFCTKKPKYKNKNNCLVTFNYWLKVRLGIKTTEDRKDKRNEFHKELLGLIKEFPLSAWEEFKRRNPKLYEKGYRARWERERRLKQKEKT